MAFVGMFALGIFVGGLVTLGFRNASTSVGDFLKVLSAVLTGTFGGAVIGFIDKYAAPGSAKIDPMSLFMYPVGLLVALLWLYAADILQQPTWIKRCGIGALFTITIVAALLALWPAFRASVS
jgi:hypothetical protein